MAHQMTASFCLTHLQDYFANVRAICINKILNDN